MENSKTRYFCLGFYKKTLLNNQILPGFSEIFHFCPGLRFPLFLTQFFHRIWPGHWYCTGVYGTALKKLAKFKRWFKANLPEGEGCCSVFTLIQQIFLSRKIEAINFQLRRWYRLRQICNQRNNPKEKKTRGFDIFTGLTPFPALHPLCRSPNLRTSNGR